MEDDILLTIAIPTYNRKNYLKECLEYLIPQIKDNIEVIVSDNASPDDTPLMMEEYINKHSYIKYHRYESSVGGFNIGNLFYMARGKYLFILCDDDIPLHGCIDNILNCIHCFPDLALISLNTCSFNKKFTGVCTKPNLDIKENLYTKDKDEFIRKVGIWISFISSMVYNMKYMKRVKNISQFIGTNFMVSHIALLTTRGNTKMAILKDVCIAARGGNNAASYDIYEIFVYRWKQLLYTSGLKSGYSIKALNDVYVNTLTTTIKGFILSAKSSSTRYYIKNKIKLVRYTYMYPVVWLKVYPYAFLPIKK
ncbi:MAG: glycosyl transferase, family 2 [Herbinix sp.]|jgi:abequosyltransferase|nr:glycosyl transferase, family 2 [Herbinix sp.]